MVSYLLARWIYCAITATTAAVVWLEVRGCRALDRVIVCACFWNDVLIWMEGDVGRRVGWDAGLDHIVSYRAEAVKVRLCIVWDTAIIRCGFWLVDWVHGVKYRRSTGRF